MKQKIILTEKNTVNNKKLAHLLHHHSNEGSFAITFPKSGHFAHEHTHTHTHTILLVVQPNLELYQKRLV